MTTITITTINQIALCSNLSLTWFFFSLFFLALVSFWLKLQLDFSYAYYTHLHRPALSLFGRFKPKFKTFCGQTTRAAAPILRYSRQLWLKYSAGLLQSIVYRLNTYISICHAHPHARNMRDNILIPFAKVQ